MVEKSYRRCGCSAPRPAGLQPLLSGFKARLVIRQSLLLAAALELLGLYDTGGASPKELAESGQLECYNVLVHQVCCRCRRWWWWMVVSATARPPVPGCRTYLGNPCCIGPFQEWPHHDPIIVGLQDAGQLLAGGDHTVGFELPSPGALNRLIHRLAEAAAAAAARKVPGATLLGKQVRLRDGHAGDAVAGRVVAVDPTPADRMLQVIIGW